MCIQGNEGFVEDGPINGLGLMCSDSRNKMNYSQFLIILVGPKSFFWIGLYF